MIGNAPGCRRGGRRHHFRFAHFGDRQAHGAMRHLEARDLHRLVRLVCGRKTTPLRRHNSAPDEVFFEGVKINRSAGVESFRASRNSLAPLADARDAVDFNLIWECAPTVCGQAGFRKNCL